MQIFVFIIMVAAMFSCSDIEKIKKDVREIKASVEKATAQQQTEKVD